MEQEKATHLKEFALWLDMEMDRWGHSSDAMHKRGRRPVQADFAKWMGVAQATLSSWFNEQRFPSVNETRKVAAKLGIEAYLKLGYPPEMPNNLILIETIRVQGKFPMAKQRELLQIAKDMEAEIERQQRNLKQQRPPATT